MTKKDKTLCLWTAVYTAKYPRGTTAGDLANCRDSLNNSALHDAARYSHLPDNITVADLANCRDDSNLTALHIAAHRGCLPNNTTAGDLANCKDHDSYSALHDAARYGHLPDNTTIADLTNCRTNKGATAWDTMLMHFNQFPTNILNTPPSLFKDHHHLAVQWVNKAVEEDPDLKAKATLWLSNVLAAK